MSDLILPSPDGPYCPLGAFHIDPWRPVAKAVISHAHSDHARSGSAAYLCETSGADLLRARIGPGPAIQALSYGEVVRLGPVAVSLHPAGHILGSSQVRMEHAGQVWVLSGDYNPRGDGRTCPRFEPLPCHTFITESTFGLPIYRWPPAEEVFADMRAWWRDNRVRGITSIVPAYPLGKSQRLLSALAGEDAPVALHGSVKTYTDLYRARGIALADTVPLDPENLADVRGRGLVITSAGSQEAGLLAKLGDTSWAFASGWMMTRAARRNRDFDRGFVLSDHADWPSLLATVAATGASRIGVTHGELDHFTRYLREAGYDAFAFPTRYSGEGLHEGLEEESLPGAASTSAS